MTIHRSTATATAPAPDDANPEDALEVTAKQHPTYQSSAARPDSQAERSVLHPDWHDPEWRYYHGAWGG